MSMTTPPGWYPDPGTPSVERWWDGTAWTGHTRPAGGQPHAPVVPPKRTGRVVQVAAAAVVVVAAVAAAVLWTRPGGGAPEAGKAPAAGPTGATPAPGTPTPSAPAEPSGPADDPGVVVDQLNGITLPIPAGWEKPERTVDRVPTVSTADSYQCPNSTSRLCRHGRVSSWTATTSATGAEAIAKEDIADAAEHLYGDDSLGNRHYGGIRSHKVVAARPAVVAGRTGYLVRWQVTTGAGPGGYVQSLAFPSPLGSEAPVVVRFAFDAGPDGPPLALMDEITRGIRPIGSSTGGGVGSSIGPGQGG
ncbi:DUF2510 domain-containing protein [Streptomyces sp. NPDC047928]|uniref:DUF2510 domain-containing protein n=1 Tax=unclassified Streptomyces TaxID=2593676 RepID=UPI00371CD355